MVKTEARVKATQKIGNRTRSERSNSDNKSSDRNRAGRGNADHRGGKPTNRHQESNRLNKPAAKRVGGTLGLKK